ncbi:MAG: RIP metalloprotease RseP [Saccharofermentans sp.]|nr:RIP metalloprotease RseP [Saccharofermentans sp.]
MLVAVSIAIILLVLGILVTGHELGHFWVASWLKIKAFEVSIFVGPKLLQWKRKGVEYTIRAIPLGAYVRFSDFDEEGNVIQDDDPSLLINQKRWKRLLVALAGPFMNLILGVVIMTIYSSVTFGMSMRTDTTIPYTQMYVAVQNNADYQDGDLITHVNGHRVFTYLDLTMEAEAFTNQNDPVILTLKSQTSGESYELVVDPCLVERPMMGFIYSADAVEEGWLIEETYENANNGNPVLKSEDILVAIDGISVFDESIEEFCYALKDGQTVTFTFIRNGEEHNEESIVNTLLVPEFVRKGIYLESFRVDSPASFFRAFAESAKTPLSIGRITGRVIQQAFKGNVEPYNVVQGPVGLTASVTEVVGQQRVSITEKIHDLILYSAIISLGLMYSNLLPIPGLDGNQIILILVEAVIGRPISRKAENVIAVVGFVLIVLLAVFALASDIIRIFLGA